MCFFLILVPLTYGRFRLNVFQQQGQLGAVFRHIERRIPKIEALHLPKILEKITLQKRGLILLVGGTGQGKSTAMAAMIGHRNKETAGHIVSIEDPIEFIHRHERCIMTQREVGIDTDSFQVALKNTFRQAPDVVVIGEIRSQETMQLAVAFACPSGKAA
jgi:twitching motility protein PilU